jgi:hypothetical protein
MRYQTVPYDEMTQLERKSNVFAILQQENLSKWALNYWGTVFETIATNKKQYDARIESAILLDEMSSPEEMRYKEYNDL